jgi:hypothetical protein
MAASPASTDPFGLPGPFSSSHLDALM